MPESIESFVKKLQDEGISAGKEAAEKIKAKAKLEADHIIDDAKARADRILADAKADSEKHFLRMQTELELTVRDVILKLGETIGQFISKMLARKIEKKFSDPEYLGEILRKVILTYAEADASQQTQIKINISDKMGENFSDGILKHLVQELSEEQEKIAFQNSLSKAGFEYTIDGTTIEVSPESLSEMISDMVSPGFQELFDKFMGKENEKISKRNDNNEIKNNISDTGEDSMKD